MPYNAHTSEYATRENKLGIILKDATWFTKKVSKESIANCQLHRLWSFKIQSSNWKLHV